MPDLELRETEQVAQPAQAPSNPTPEAFPIASAGPTKPRYSVSRKGMGGRKKTPAKVKEKRILDILTKPPEPYTPITLDPLPPRQTVITPELVRDLGELTSLGLTQEQACFLRKVNLTSLEWAFRRRPMLRKVYLTAKAAWVHRAVTTLADSPRGHQGLQFLLTTRHADQFTRTTQVQHGLSPEIGNLFRDAVKSLTQPKPKQAKVIDVK